MSVAIRLSRLGKNKNPHYRIVVCDKESKRNGRHLEYIGTYNTLTKPSTIKIKEDRLKYWIGVGAEPTPTMARVIEKQFPGYYSGILAKRKAKITAARTKRKARAKKTATKAAKK